MTTRQTLAVPRIHKDGCAMGVAKFIIRFTGIKDHKMKAYMNALKEDIKVLDPIYGTAKHVNYVENPLTAEEEDELCEELIASVRSEEALVRAKEELVWRVRLRQVEADRDEAIYRYKMLQFWVSVGILVVGFALIKRN
jgi:hypothetical protein